MGMKMKTFMYADHVNQPLEMLVSKNADFDVKIKYTIPLYKLSDRCISIFIIFIFFYDVR